MHISYTCLKKKANFNFLALIKIHICNETCNNLSISKDILLTSTFIPNVPCISSSITLERVHGIISFNVPNTPNIKVDDISSCTGRSKS